MPSPIGTFTSYPEFVALLRQRKDELGLSNDALDDLAGFTRGHTDKLNERSACQACLGNGATRGNAHCGVAAKTG
jgi:hypothetical protein